MRRPRLLFCGLGPIGASTLRYAVQRGDTEVVGGVDIDTAKVGRDLGEIAGLATPLGLPVHATLAECLPAGGADIAVLCTHSAVRDVEAQVIELLAAGLNVVSTCEELSYPYRHHPAESARIHEAAMRHGATVLGTGVNPGFVMDLLPIILSTVCLRVDCVHVRRVVDAGTRRGPLQAKVGAGLSEPEFLRRAESGGLGHRGLVESVAMIADALNLPIDEITEDVRPKLAERSIGELGSGQVAGIDQTAQGFHGGDVLISLRLLVYIGAHDPRDRIVVTGEPCVKATLEGGTPGDHATAAAVLSAIHPVLDAPPGLTTVNRIAGLCCRRP